MNSLYSNLEGEKINLGSNVNGDVKLVSQAGGLNAPGGTIVLYVAGTAALLTFTFSKYPMLSRFFLYFVNITATVTTITITQTRAP